MADAETAQQRPPAIDDGPGVRAHAWRTTFAALCATLVGIGLSRFAYTPLIPALIDAGCFTPGQAAYLGAANLVGYLAGAAYGLTATIEKRDDA